MADWSDYEIKDEPQEAPWYAPILEQASNLHNTIKGFSSKASPAVLGFLSGDLGLDVAEKAGSFGETLPVKSIPKWKEDRLGKYLTLINQKRELPEL